MILGFTGTREGMNDSQKDHLREFLSAYASEIETVVHGDCVGADTEFHALVREVLPEARIELRPGISGRDGSAKTRAYNKGDHLHDSMPYAQRDRAIVDQCTYLIGAPLDTAASSGSMRTLRYAAKVRKQGMVLLREGSTISIEDL